MTEVQFSLKEFENPTSAPLIAPVDTITPVPLLYHIRTFYIVRYSSPATHPSQPTYTINELQKGKRKRNKGGFLKKEANNKQIHTSTQTKYNVPIRIIIQTITTSTTNIKIFHFKRHSTS